MGVELKLTDKELPVSPVFIDYLAHLVDGKPFSDHAWHDQLSETLNQAQKEIAQKAPTDAGRVMSDARGRALIGRCYQLLMALLTADLNALKDIQMRYHFVNVVGIPRNGGSYLTKELFRALGYDPSTVPNALAHDGFPEAGPFSIKQGVNSWVQSLHTMAEFLVMVETFYANGARRSGKIIVPKKLTKGIYAGGFFHQVLGEAVEHIFTLRHPVASCISTYEKSGGLPENGLFTVRSNIEEWCRRDLNHTGESNQRLLSADYFSVYLRYWEQYHLNVATTGLSASTEVKLVVYGKERLEALARSFHRRYESDTDITEFKVSEENRSRHPQWIEQAEPVIQRVAAVWESVGMKFDLAELRECW